MNRINRFGAYGVLLHNSTILLTLKRSGPYKGLWDLPGGGIEFGETPEETLERELLEESALSVTELELLRVATAVGLYDNQGIPYQFHHVGIIYKIVDWTKRLDLTPEEENRWARLNDLTLDELTPIARAAVVSLHQPQ